MSIRPLGLLACCVVWASASACSSESEHEPLDPGDPNRVGFDQRSIDELKATGIDRYMGKFTPSEVFEHSDTETGYRFEPDEQGPICINGSAFEFGLRDTGSSDLVVYLQGGGACWSELCAANEGASNRIPSGGWSEGDNPEHPFHGWNFAHISYCDGSVFSGDAIYEGGGKKRFHRGLANLTASLDVIKEKFPEPKRIVLAGSSAGGYGTLLGTVMVRLFWPSTPLAVFNDAGLGLTNPENPNMLSLIKKEWKFDQFLPASCEACQTGQLTEVIGWALERDPSLRVGAFSSYGDTVIGVFFLGMLVTDFKALVLNETGAIHDKFPQRFKRYLVEGEEHTSAGDIFKWNAEGERLTNWVSGLVEGDEGWVDVVENQGQD